MNEHIVLGLIILAISVCGYYEFTQGTSPYRGRNCNGKAWKAAFPSATKESIRLFLDCFVDGMALSSKIKLKFHPNDQVIDVHRSLYFGKTPEVDQMECETFLENLSNDFNIELDELVKSWHEQVTLGELYEKVTTPPSTGAL
jgi:propanediol dehydratase small subunit